MTVYSAFSEQGKNYRLVLDVKTCWFRNFCNCPARGSLRGRSSKTGPPIEQPWFDIATHWGSPVAKSAYLRDLAIYEADPATYQKEIGDVLGYLETTRDEFELAEGYFRRGLEAHENVYGPDSLKMVPILGFYAGMLRKSKMLVRPSGCISAF